MTDATLTIGEVAKLVGLKASAIRYYESIGVLPEPDRDYGQRRYTGATVRRLRVIAIAKRAGFSLDDARVLLATEIEGGPAHEPLRDLAQRKLAEVDALIERAQAMRAWLSLATGCGCQTLDACALFDPTTAGSQLASRDRAAPALSITHVGSRVGVPAAQSRGRQRAA